MSSFKPSANGMSRALLAPLAPAARSAWNVLCRYVPAVGALRTYSWQDLGKDAVAGVTVATVAVPQAMAYAIAAGIDPRYGLYTAIVMTTVGALFDSSRQLINGPTNAISIAVLSALAFLPTEHEKVAAAVLLALLMGLTQTGITLLRLGDLTRFISHGVIVGFTVGAGVLLILDQLKNLLGLPQRGTADDHFIIRFWHTLIDGTVDGPTAAIGLGTIALVLGLRWLKKRLRARWRVPIPELLFSIMVMSAVVWALELDQDGVKVVGEIPAALPSLTAPNVEWGRVRQLAGSALAIALLGLLEAVAMAKAIAAQTGQRLDINQQCLSEGLANMAGSFFQCMPGSGSLTRSTINQQAGAVSQWSGVISAAAVAVTVLLFAHLAYHIPRAALAGILILTAWRMVDRKQLFYHLRTTRYDAGIVLATAVAAVVISVEFCILIGVFLSFVLYVPRAARLDFTELAVTPERVIRERVASDPPCDRILMYNLEGELIFAAAPDLERNFDRIAARARTGARVIVLRVKRVRNPDAVCLALVERFVRRMRANGTEMLLCGVRRDLAQALRNSGLRDLLGPEQIFYESPVLISSTLEAVRRAYELLGKDYCATCPRRGRAQGDESWYYMI
jgi:SulP family sulfate permease